MDIFWLLFILFIFVTLIFVALALLFPEWVGITGKVAKQMEAEQRGTPVPSESSPSRGSTESSGMPPRES